MSLCCLCVRDNKGPHEKLIWDPNTQRERRMVVFPGEEIEEDEASGSSDDEDGNSEDSDQEEQEERDEEEDNLSTFLKDARAKSGKSEKNVTGGAPPVKKQRLEEKKGERDVIAEAPAFADSEDELEISEGESDEEGEAGRAGDSGHCSEEDDGDSDDEEEEEDSEDESMEEEEDAVESAVKEQKASEEEEEEEEEQGK